MTKTTDVLPLPFLKTVTGIALLFAVFLLSVFNVVYAEETPTSSPSSLVLSPAEKQWLKEHPVIRLGSDFGWPPFEKLGAKAQYEGIAADFMKLVEGRLGVKFETSPLLPWTEILNKTKNRELDVLPVAQSTAARRTFMLFTKPYLSQAIVIVTRDDVGYVDGLSALTGKTVAYQKDSQPINQIMVRYPEITQSIYTDNLDALSAVAKGKVFAYVGNIATVSYMMRTEGFTNLKVSGQLDQRFELSVAVRDDWPLMLSVMQKALDSITMEERNTIFQKWINVKVDPELGFRQVIQYLAVAAAIFLLFLVWNMMLKSKVRQVSEELQHRSYYDPLTNLPNRFLINDRLNQLIQEANREQKYVAVLSVGLDNLNEINSTLGLSTGDQFIAETSNRIQRVLRTGDSVGRFEGDTFILLVGGLENPNEADSLVEALLNQFKPAFVMGGRELNVTASIGVAFFPTDGQEAPALFDHSGSALQYAKKHGKNRLSFYTQSMNEKANRKLQLDEAMVGALERGEFQVHYQPKIDIKTGEISGFEALLRWFHPVLGNVRPDEFIAVAEANGLILPIGEFVIKEALRCVTECGNDNSGHFSMAVNLSPVQFRDASLVEKIGRYLDYAGASPEQLEFEITEGVLMTESEPLLKSLNDLKALGIKISMDDFGTGYSSLSYLQKYPFDVIKIEREFIMGLEEDSNKRQLVIATIAMAHGLGLQVVAEGVETGEQLEFLSEQGCDIAQGYFFSPAVPANEVNGLFH
ncbi:EAL domain-containing protein [Thiomicrorhabdus sp. ZW0627]|uniref:EAL domain-containing protein n=1 Tax=Thiomicrorhabdus sp. ZW0627 TaxID=3039774 RepID=UPI0024372A15|nr:EAL domain-containing protein [Thiomicrorhabdus sp. ZW0627]MDG6773178.1 EAL domain-containing protein [Thiomicrorhabdus sp. ZW0627]